MKWTKLTLRIVPTAQQPNHHTSIGSGFERNAFAKKVGWSNIPRGKTIAAAGNRRRQLPTLRRAKLVHWSHRDQCTDKEHHSSPNAKMIAQSDTTFHDPRSELRMT
ncbi:hypothetical protein N9D23_06130 [Rubripirellula sp.]|nr:hypothetical protein [Rubripirellula sp.]